MNEKPAPKRLGLFLISVGSIITSMAVAGFLLGLTLDHFIDSKPLFMLLFGLLGLVGGFMRALQMLVK